MSYDDETKYLCDTFSCTLAEADELWSIISCGDNFQCFQRALEWLLQKGLLKEAL